MDVRVLFPPRVHSSRGHVAPGAGLSTRSASSVSLPVIHEPLLGENHGVTDSEMDTHSWYLIQIGVCPWSRLMP